jgi:hypothetical protein
MASKKQRVEYFGGALAALCELMCSFGVSRETTQQQFEIAMQKGYVAAATRSVRDAGPLSSMADLCRRWYIEKLYVDRSGKPKVLTWNGKTGTLLTLAVRVNGKKNAKKVIESLIAHKHIRRVRSGGWIPKAQVVAPSGFNAAQVLRAATMFERLLSTVAYNSERNYRGEVLLEVMAQVPRLPAREIRSFKKFAKTQGLIFAMSVDDWLESRNIPRNKRTRVPTRQAGVIAFAFEQPALRV